MNNQKEIKTKEYGKSIEDLKRLEIVLNDLKKLLEALK